MKVAILNWRDSSHPKAGGAEVLTEVAASGMAARGHGVTLLASAWPGAPKRESRNGYEIIRAGGEVTCRFHAARWLMGSHRRLDVVVDEVNTLPFLSPLICRDKTILYIQQIAREVWLAEAPPGVGAFGYLLEPAMMAIYRSIPVIALSESTAKSCRGLGLRGPIDVLPPAIDEPQHATAGSPIPGRIGYVGRLNRSKRVDHIIEAVAIVRQTLPHVTLEIVGRGPEDEVARLRRLADALDLASAVIFRGHVSQVERDAAFGRFDVLALASQREGWGLVVSEAGYHRVPAAVYPVAGLVDSTVHDVTGLHAAAETPEALAAAIKRIIADRGLRSRLAEGANNYVRQFTTARMVDGFERLLARRASGDLRVECRAAVPSRSPRNA